MIYVDNGVVNVGTSVIKYNIRGIKWEKQQNAYRGV